MFGRPRPIDRGDTVADRLHDVIVDDLIVFEHAWMQREHAMIGYVLGRKIACRGKRASVFGDERITSMHDGGIECSKFARDVWNQVGDDAIGADVHADGA